MDAPPFKPVPVRPFDLPLTRAQFAHALQSGLGRAVMQAQQCDCGTFAELVVDACVHSRCYDAQCEDNRTDWVMNIADAAGLRDAVLAGVLRQLAADPATVGFWDSLQLCRLAYLFAQEGSQDARRALYGAFRQNTNSADLIGGQEIIALDCPDGLLFVAQRVGTWIKSTPDFWAEQPVQWYDEAHGEGSALRILERAAASSADVSLYLEALTRQPKAEGVMCLDQWFPSDLPRAKVEQAPAEAVILAIGTQEPTTSQHAFEWEGRQHSLTTWGSRARPEELLQVADAMFHEAHPARLQKYLRVFSRCGMPQFDPRLLDLARHVDRGVRECAFRALGRCEHPSIRDLALACVGRGEIMDGQLRLFRGNYRAGDHAAIESALVLHPSADQLHGEAYDLVVALEDCVFPEIAELMLFVYEHSPCGNCRRRAIMTLQRIDALPSWVREECKHDAVAGIRAAVGAE